MGTITIWSSCLKIGSELKPWRRLLPLRIRILMIPFLLSMASKAIWLSSQFKLHLERNLQLSSAWFSSSPSRISTLKAFRNFSRAEVWGTWLNLESHTRRLLCPWSTGNALLNINGVCLQEVVLLLKVITPNLESIWLPFQPRIMRVKLLCKFSISTIEK